MSPPARSRITVVALALIIAPLLPAPLAAEGEANGTTVVYLVRHAEKETSPAGDRPKGPALTEAGRARARLLAAMLREETIDRIHSTDLTRTLDTAKPLSERLGVGIDLYDPRELKSFAAELLASGGRHVVVGHSNTTHELVELLGGEPGSGIEETGEYDRLCRCRR